MNEICGAVSFRRSGGEPPTHLPDEAPVVVGLDARFDNRGDLARELGWGPEELGRRGDRDLVETLWLRHGPEFVQRLQGDFAIVLHDRRIDRVFLTRDCLGQRPLHFQPSPFGCLFASLPSAIAAGAGAGLSVQRIVDFLLDVPDSFAGSFFDEVDLVAPGETVIVSADRVERRRWWQPNTEPLSVSIDQAAEEARWLFSEAVAARLGTASPVIAAQLSGGLDSSAVLAFAARALAPGEQRLLALTAVPRSIVPGSERFGFVDEARRAAALAEMYPTVQHRPVAAEPRCLFRTMRDLHALYDRPIANYCNEGWDSATYAAAAEAGADVMLIGLAGNFSISFGGMMMLPDLVRSGRWRDWLTISRRAHDLRGANWRGLLAQSFAPFLPQPVWGLAKRFRRQGSAPAIEDRAFLRRDHPFVAEARRRAAAAGEDLLQRGERDSIAFRLRAITTSDPGNINHGLRRRWGIETRDPTADRRLVEFCLRLPPEHYFDGRKTRLLARKMLEGLVPEETRLEERRGYQGADWLEPVELSLPAMRREVDEIAADGALSDLFDHETMRSMIDHWPASGWEDPAQVHDYRTKLVRTLACANWLRTHGGRVNRDAAADGPWGGVGDASSA